MKPRDNTSNHSWDTLGGVVERPCLQLHLQLAPRLKAVTGWRNMLSVGCSQYRSSQLCSPHQKSKARDIEILYLYSLCTVLRPTTPDFTPLPAWHHHMPWWAHTRHSPNAQRISCKCFIRTLDCISQVHFPKHLRPKHTREITCLQVQKEWKTNQSPHSTPSAGSPSIRTSLDRRIYPTSSTLSLP